LITKAQSGDVAAIREIGDRLDGCVALAINGLDEGPIAVEHSRAVDFGKLSEAELAALEHIVGRLDEGDAEENNE
jgi:hypothetical protein